MSARGEYRAAALEQAPRCVKHGRGEYPCPSLPCATCYLVIMNTVEQRLACWRASLLESIPIAGLLSRNSVAYKWKAPFRCWLVREAAFWRETDLLSQSYALHQQGHGLGARILLRSGLETLATLIYLNHIMRQVLDRSLDFHVFSTETMALALGSRDKSTPHQAVHVLKMLQKSERHYPGITGIYDILCESAHPNNEGLLLGYSKFDHSEYETTFSNRWMDLHGESHLPAIEPCIEVFQHEYDEVWTDLMSRLEIWITENDAQLEVTKNITGYR